uniref:Uncharacterized protein n=1 Tax=Parastrongyloides trichosuri TaxID=131310 RepID=A0A0N4ZYF9_PARTI
MSDDDTIVYIGVFIFVAAVVIIGGMVGFFLYKKNKKEKEKAKDRKRSGSKKRKSSRSSSGSRSKSSRRKSRSRSKSGSSGSKSKSSSSKSGSSSSRSRSSSEKRPGHSRRSSGSRKKKSSRRSRHSGSSNSDSSKSPKSLEASPNNSFPGEIKVSLPAKKDTGSPVQTGNLTILSPPPKLEQQQKPLPNPQINDINKSLQDKPKIKTPPIPKDDKLTDDKNFNNTPVDIKPYHPTIVFEGCPSSKQISNDLLKYKTNTHYIPPTTVDVPKVDEKSSPVENKLKGDDKSKQPGEVAVGMGSLLTSTNITYNNVNVMVNNTQDSEITEVVKAAVNAIPEPTLNLSDLPGLPTNKDEE